MLIYMYKGDYRSQMDILIKQKLIFSKIFSLSNKLYTIGEKPLNKQLTIRQWLITVAVANFGECNPTFSEVAAFVGTSHQNIKQLALKLEKNGYMKIQKDTDDLRRSLLILTEDYYEFMKERHKEMENFLEELFRDFNIDEIGEFQESLNKVYEGVKKMEVEK